MTFLRRYERLTIDITRIEVCTKVYAEKRYIWKGGNTERDIHERRYTRRDVGQYTHGKVYQKGSESRRGVHMEKGCAWWRYIRRGITHGKAVLYIWREVLSDGK